MGLGRELEGLELVPTNPVNFNSYADSFVPYLKEFRGKIKNNIIKTADKIAEVAGSTSTYVKITAVVSGIVSFPEGTPESIEMYNFGNKLSSVETYAKATSFATKGEGKEAAIELSKEAVGNKVESKIVKNSWCR